MPPEYPSHPNPQISRKLAQEQYFGWTQQELDNLQYFTRRGCFATPKLLQVVSLEQDDHMPVPGGLLRVLSSGNIIYDEKQNRCWIIDYEDVSTAEHVKPIQVSKLDLYLWGLVDRGENDEDIW
ncbi:hypothetical protein FQN50_006077 [Emmonsiellopsis sp. PD_5]|nr:hypothetical protein FQN50_006077 [Emmonsiellopsis sp. PD_5]